MVAYVINDMEVTDPKLLEDYKKLVVENHQASSAGGYYGGSGLDSTKIAGSFRSTRKSTS